MTNLIRAAGEQHGRVEQDLQALFRPDIAGIEDDEILFGEAEFRPVGPPASDGCARGRPSCERSSHVACDALVQKSLRHAVGDRHHLVEPAERETPEGEAQRAQPPETGMWPTAKAASTSRSCTCRTVFAPTSQPAIAPRARQRASARHRRWWPPALDDLPEHHRTGGERETQGREQAPDAAHLLTQQERGRETPGRGLHWPWNNDWNARPALSSRDNGAEW